MDSWEWEGLVLEWNSLCDSCVESSSARGIRGVVLPENIWLLEGKYLVAGGKIFGGIDTWSWLGGGGGAGGEEAALYLGGGRHARHLGPRPRHRGHGGADQPVSGATCNK